MQCYANICRANEITQEERALEDNPSTNFRTNAAETYSKTSFIVCSSLYPPCDTNSRKQCFYKWFWPVLGDELFNRITILTCIKSLITLLQHIAIQHHAWNQTCLNRKHIACETRWYTHWMAECRVLFAWYRVMQNPCDTVRLIPSLYGRLRAMSTFLIWKVQRWVPSIELGRYHVSQYPYWFIFNTADWELLTRQCKCGIGGQHTIVNKETREVKELHTKL